MNWDALKVPLAPIVDLDEAILVQEELLLIERNPEEELYLQALSIFIAAALKGDIDEYPISNYANG